MYYSLLIKILLYDWKGRKRIRIDMKRMQSFYYRFSLTVLLDEEEGSAMVIRTLMHLQIRSWHSGEIRQRNFSSAEQI